MNKEELIRFLNSNTKDIKEVCTLISDYLVEMKFNNEAINQFIVILSSNLILISKVLPKVTDYYLYKFHIDTLKDKNGVIIKYF